MDWRYRGLETDTGAATLDIPVPAGVVDGDLLVLAIAHRGAGYATVDPSWTLIGQGLSGAVRGEWFWKRASSEPAVYTITGMATASRGGIYAYEGVIPTGDPIDAFAISLNPPGVSDIFPAGLTTTTEQTLLLGSVATDGRVGAGWLMYSNAAPGTPTLFDQTYQSFRVLSQIDWTGTTCGLFVAEAIKWAVGNTGRAVKGPFAGTSTVGLFVAFKRDPAPPSAAGSRYFLGLEDPPTSLVGTLQGVWEVSETGPEAYGVTEPVQLLSQSAQAAGRCYRADLLTNLEQSDVIWKRYATPPLASQTLGGTVTWIAGTDQDHELSPDTPVGSAAFKMHAYVTVGDSLTPRTTVVDNAVDPVVWDGPPGLYKVRGFLVTLNPVSVVAGDRLVFELGVRQVAAGPFPPPAIPPYQWIRAQLIYGACINPYRYWNYGVGFDFTPAYQIRDNRIAYAPAPLYPIGYLPDDYEPVGSFSLMSDLSVPARLEFSNALIELPPAGDIPTNTTFATAAPLPALPTTVTRIMTRHPNAEGGWPCWWAWTCPTAGRYLFHAFGSTARTEIRCYDSEPLHGSTLLDSDDVAESRGNYYVGRSVSYLVLNALAGKTYYFRTGQSYPNGLLRLSAQAEIPLSNNDVLIATVQYILRYTASGQLAQVMGRLGGSATGLAIDYSLRELPSSLGGTHQAHRLLVALFGTDPYVLLLDLANVGLGLIDEIRRPPFSADDLHISSLAAKRDGTLYAGYFGTGFTRIAGELSYMAERSYTPGARINKTDVGYGGEYAPWPPPSAATYPVELEAGGTNYVELTPDEAELYYTSGGWYIPIGGQTVFRMDAATGAQLSDFAVVPVGPGPNPGLKGLFPLPVSATTPEGGCLVCNGSEVVRLNAAGVVVQTYQPTPTDFASTLIDVELQADGQAFWVLEGETTSLFKFDIRTGAQLAHVFTEVGSNTCTSLVIYRKDGFEVIPPIPPRQLPGCPTDLLLNSGSSLSGCPSDLTERQAR